MKKLVLVMLTLAALMISVPVAMARDANWHALDKVWKDQVKQENQQNQRVRMERLKAVSEWDIVVPDTTKSGTPQTRIERLKPVSEWDIVAPDPTKPGTPPGRQRPGRR